MHNPKILSIILLLFATLAASSLACNLSAASPTPTAVIAVSTEAVGSLLDKLKAAEEQMKSGAEVEMVLTEVEITSLIAYEMEEVNQQPFSDVQVTLREGQARLNGSYQDGSLTLPIAIVAEPEVSSGGNLRLVIVSAKLGPVSAPDVLWNEFQAIIDKQLTQILTYHADGNIKVSSIKIADGTITIRGTRP